MNSTALYFFRAFNLILLLGTVGGCSTTVYSPKSDKSPVPKSFVSARRDLLDTVGPRGLIWSGGKGYGSRSGVPLKLRVNPTALEILTEDARHLKSLQFRDLPYVSVGSLLGDLYVSEVITWRGPHVTDAKFHCWGFRDLEEAQRAACALNALISQARSHSTSQAAAEFEAFKLQARAWRELAAKPAYPAEVERRRILIEHAVAEKKYDDALEHLEAGLAAAPLWPEGHYNAALLYAEIEAYRFAADHMRRYLELVPKASEASAMREKIVVWDAKAK